MRRAAVLLLLLAACRDVEREEAVRNAAMKHDLVEMRKAIADFRADKKRGPHSLEELKTAKYLRDIPKDPLTLRADWRVTTETAVRNDDFASSAAPAAEPEVIDVHSRAPGRDASGKLYSEY
jgi:general secretion pathway protein G